MTPINFSNRNMLKIWYVLLLVTIFSQQLSAQIINEKNIIDQEICTYKISDSLSVINDNFEKRHKYREKYIDNSGIYSYYVVDSISISDIFLLRNKDGHIFAFTSIPELALLKTETIHVSDCFILELNFFDVPFSYMTTTEYLGLQNKYVLSHPIDFPKKQTEYNKTYDRVCFDIPPHYYLLILVQGKMYNWMTYYRVMDGQYIRPLQFNDDDAYYKVLVPFWIAQ